MALQSVDVNAATKKKPGTTGNGATRPDNPAERFTKAKDTVKHRLIMSVMGKEKEGKTHFALTAPGPIGYLNLDKGYEGVGNRFESEKEIFKSDYNIQLPKRGTDMNKVAELLAPHWENALEDIDYSIQNFRTSIIDTGTELWELCRIARFGKLDQVKPHHYGPVNREFRDQIYGAAYNSDCNLIVLHKLKAEYLNDKKTGNYERSGFSDTGFVVQTEVLCYRVGVDEREELGDLGFRLRVESCRQNPSIEGEILSGPMLNFPFLATLIFPDTTLDDWQ
jgi:hypothetical protein